MTRVGAPLRAIGFVPYFGRGLTLPTVVGRGGEGWLESTVQTSVGIAGR